MGIAHQLQVMGMIVSGDIGPLTIYTDRHGRKIAFPKAPPKEPPTDLQVSHRARFRSAQQEYMALSHVKRNDWERLSRRASLCMTGQNLYIHIAMKGGLVNLDTLMRQTGLTVDPPTIV